MREPMILLYVGFLLTILSTHSGCPSSYNQISPDLCVVRLTTANTFCRACEMCAQYGAARGHLAFLLGRNANRVFPVTAEPGYTWLGFTKFLTEPSLFTIGWRDVDPRTPGFTTTGSEMIWSGLELQDDQPVAVIYKDGVIYDCTVDCFGLPLTVYCEYGGVLPIGPLQQQYRSDFPLSLTDLIRPGSKVFGCFLEVNSSSIIDCARKCTLEVACRSLYYGDYSRRCIHTMYADALLPEYIASGETDWKRFAKVSYARIRDEL
ncbi:hypothetical protein CRM22_001849 [Opisthorchis felineus]|uniref:Apple domain-containing protein n=1 Tax=Opisthorchis felineus TaxID=147828 RepID=A0A4S2MF38_OPIFE|nr:hypothetical protein CRM22_003125 [Opisthorchis felineus]TGZ72827.1 hypothetical protein CRM22_001849 [Opisthorchis felineus]